MSALFNLFQTLKNLFTDNCLKRLVRALPGGRPQPGRVLGAVLAFSLLGGGPLAAREENLPEALGPGETISLTKLVPDYESQDLQIVHYRVVAGDTWARIFTALGLDGPGEEQTRLRELVRKLNPEIKGSKRLPAGQALTLPAAACAQFLSPGAESVKVYEVTQDNQRPARVEVLRRRPPVLNLITDEEILIKDGQKDGLVRAYYGNGNIRYEMPYKKGKREGLHKTFYKNGALESERPYKDDKLEGQIKDYYENGKVEHENFFQNGKEKGPEKRYYGNGALSSEVVFRDGYQEAKEYYENGALFSQVDYKGGQKEGLLKGYYESGALKEETPYKDGEKEGLAKAFYESGALKCETPFEDGVLHGITKTYYESGALKGQMPYQYGRREGPLEIYRENGELSAKIEFKYDSPVKGLSRNSEGTETSLTDVDMMDDFINELEDDIP